MAFYNPYNITAGQVFHPPPQKKTANNQGQLVTYQMKNPGYQIISGSAGPGESNGSKRRNGLSTEDPYSVDSTQNAQRLHELCLS